MTYRHNNQRTIRRRLAAIGAYVTASAIFVFVSASSLRAELTDTSEEQTSEKIIEYFCENNGKLARCAGQMANDCAKIVKPHVDECIGKLAQQGSRALGDVFERCFWKGFIAQYGKGFDYSSECFYSDNKDGNPLQPVPRELEGKMKLLNSKP